MNNAEFEKKKGLNRKKIRTIDQTGSGVGMLWCFGFADAVDISNGRTG
jgi:hypothetical protein